MSTVITMETLIRNWHRHRSTLCRER